MPIVLTISFNMVSSGPSPVSIKDIFHTAGYEIVEHSHNLFRMIDSITIWMGRVLLTSAFNTVWVLLTCRLGRRVHRPSVLDELNLDTG